MKEYYNNPLFSDIQIEICLLTTTNKKLYGHRVILSKNKYFEIRLNSQLMPINQNGTIKIHSNNIKDMTFLKIIIMLIYGYDFCDILHKNEINEYNISGLIKLCDKYFVDIDLIKHITFTNFGNWTKLKSKPYFKFTKSCEKIEIKNQWMSCKWICFSYDFLAKDHIYINLEDSDFNKTKLHKYAKEILYGENNDIYTISSEEYELEDQSCVYEYVFKKYNLITNKKIEIGRLLSNEALYSNYNDLFMINNNNNFEIYKITDKITIVQSIPGLNYEFVNIIKVDFFDKYIIASYSKCGTKATIKCFDFNGNVIWKEKLNEFYYKIDDWGIVLINKDPNIIVLGILSKNKLHYYDISKSNNFQPNIHKNNFLYLLNEKFIIYSQEKNEYILYDLKNSSYEIIKMPNKILYIKKSQSKESLIIITMSNLEKSYKIDVYNINNLNKIIFSSEFKCNKKLHKISDFISNF